MPDHRASQDRRSRPNSTSVDSQDWWPNLAISLGNYIDISSMYTYYVRARARTHTCYWGLATLFSSI